LVETKNRWSRLMHNGSIPPGKLKALVPWLAAIVLVATAAAQGWSSGSGGQDLPEAEFHMARMVYPTNRCAGSRGFCNPMWAVDYPEAEANFLPALRRMTNIAVADDSRHLRITDDRIFDYPWLFVQQVAAGNWRPTLDEVERLREYLLRGGFLVVDDFHGEGEWAYFQQIIQEVLPGRPIVDLQDDDPLANLFYDLDLSIQIPGERHLRGWGRGRRGGGGGMSGPPNWRGIRDDHGRLMVAINHNVDMGDAWEHADDPYYPAEMTATAYRFGVNYVIYAMTR
jgi:hypothetical protein